MSLRNLHYQLGVLAALFLCLFAVTGLLLQYADPLRLNARYAPAWLVSPLYGVKTTTATHYRSQAYWVSHAGDWLYLDGQPVPGVAVDNLQGAIQTDEGIWIAVNGELLLLSKTRRIIDRLSVAEALGRVARMGKDRQGAPVVAAASGHWRITSDLRLEPAGDADPWVIWSEAVPTSQAPALLEQRLLRHANHHLISWERVIIDLHNGQIGGSIGKTIANLMSLLILLVATTGVLSWLRNNKPSDQSSSPPSQSS